MLLVLAAADGLAADRSSRFAASWLAALAAEQAGVGLLILTNHGETNHGDQDGNRRQNDTIHLKLLPRECGKKQLSRNIDRRNCSLPCAASTVGCGWVNASLSLAIASGPIKNADAEVGGSQNLGGMHRLFASANLGRTKLPDQLSLSSGRWQAAWSAWSSRVTVTLTTRKHSTRYSERGEAPV